MIVPTYLPNPPPGWGRVISNAAFPGHDVYGGQSDIEGPHTHLGDRPNWNMLLTLEGEVTLNICGQNFVFGPQTLFLIAPGPPRRFTVPGCWKAHFLHFDMGAHISIPPEWPEAGKCVYSMVLARNDFVAIRRVFDEFYRVCKIKRHGWYLLAYHLIQELILRGNMACQAALGEHIEETAKMLDNIDTARSIDTVAGKCAMSRTSFFAKFRSTFGTTPAKYREQQTLSQVQFMLESSDMSIKEIAEKLHICQSSYLIKRFKKAFGVSPREYRRKHRADISDTSLT